jgi:hypothetical protein
VYNIFFVTLIGNTMDIGENNRFRYTIDPFVLVLGIFILRNAVFPSSMGEPENNGNILQLRWKGDTS